MAVRVRLRMGSGGTVNARMADPCLGAGRGSGLASALTVSLFGRGVGFAPFAGETSPGRRRAVVVAVSGFMPCTAACATTRNANLSGVGGGSAMVAGLSGLGVLVRRPI